MNKLRPYNELRKLQNRFDELQKEFTACENIIASQKDRIDELLLIISNLKCED